MTSHFEFIGTATAGGAKRLKNSERIRQAAAEGNSQFKNAFKFANAPCLLMIFHDGIDVPEEEIIQSAVYGDLKYSFPEGRFGEGKLVLSGNGAWGPDKKRTTSALLYIRNGGEPLLIPQLLVNTPSTRALQMQRTRRGGRWNVSGN